MGAGDLEWSSILEGVGGGGGCCEQRIWLHNHFNTLKDETHPWQRARALNCIVILDRTSPLEAASLHQRYVLTRPCLFSTQSVMSHCLLVVFMGVSNMEAQRVVPPPGPGSGPALA